MMDNVRERDKQLATLKSMLDNLPPDVKQAYLQCVRTEGLFKTILPCALALGTLSYYFAPARTSSKARIGAGIFGGVLGYMIGKISYIKICSEKYIPGLAQMVKEKGLFKSQIEPEGSSISFNESVDSESQSSNFNNYFNEDGTQFDINSNFEEDTMDKPINLKPKLTYDDLRKQSRSQYYKPTERHTPSMNHKYVSKPMPEQDEELLEDTTFKSGTKEDFAWN